MTSYAESYDYEALTANTAAIRNLKNSDNQNQSFLANIAISGLENDKIINKFDAENLDIYNTGSDRDVEESEDDIDDFDTDYGDNDDDMEEIEQNDENQKQTDAYSIKNFPAYLNAIEKYIKNARSKVRWHPVCHKKISNLLDDFRRLRRSEWSEFEHRKVIGNTLTYLAEAQVRRVTLLEQYELKARQAIDSMANGLTFNELAKDVGSALTPRLLKKLGRKAMGLFSKNKPTAFGEKMENIEEDELAKLSADAEEDEFFYTLRKYDVDETPEKSEGTTEALGLLASTLRPGTSCEKDYNMILRLSRTFVENYYDESSSSSNATDFDRLEFRHDDVSNKLLQRMLTLLFVFAKYDLKDKPDIKKIFNPPEEDKKLFSKDDNGVWNTRTFKFGGDGESIEHYSSVISDVIQDRDHPITKVYDEFKTKIFSDSFTGLERDASKTFFANFCGNMSSSKMQEVYTELMKPELSYKNISPIFGDRFEKKDKK